jgi:uncharacterized membrane protein YgcG
MKYVRLLFAGLLVALSAMLGVLGTSSPAYADSGTFFSRYDFDVTLRSNGWADVTTYLDLDFTAQRGRGPMLTFITQMDEPGTKRYRVIEYKYFTVTSPTGASTQIHHSSDGNTETYQIGDENRYYNDVQSYVITYSVFGLVEPDHSSGFDEFNWNIIGESFDLRIVNPSVTLRGPATVTSKGACFYGSTFSTPCDATTTGSTVTYKAPTLQAGQGMQIGAGYPVGTFVGAEPTYREHTSVGEDLAGLFEPTPLNVSVGAVAALIGVGSLKAARRRYGRDEVFAGVTPGSIPPEGTGQVVMGQFDTVAVAFTPPAGVRPGEAAILMHGGSASDANGADLSATIVDLAVRGFITISEEQTSKFLGLGTSQDWTLTLTNKPWQGLFAYEVGILELLRDKGGPVRLKNLTSTESSARDLLAARGEITDHAIKSRNWFRGNPTVTRTVWAVLATIGIFVGFFVFVGGSIAGVGYMGVAMIGVSVAALIMGMSLTNRTAVGSAVYAQLRGFKEYIATAEADQLRWEAGEDIYSAYLPWAIVFDEVEHWTKLFAQLEAMGRYTPNMLWYYSPYGNSFSTGSMTNFSEGLVSMTSSMQSMISSASSYASSGSSSGMGGGSFSGGGGGFGGGGGGSW